MTARTSFTSSPRGRASAGEAPTEGSERQRGTVNHMGRRLDTSGLLSLQGPYLSTVALKPLSGVAMNRWVDVSGWGCGWPAGARVGRDVGSHEDGARTGAEGRQRPLAGRLVLIPVQDPRAVPVGDRWARSTRGDTHFPQAFWGPSVRRGGPRKGCAHSGLTTGAIPCVHFLFILRTTQLHDLHSYVRIFFSTGK